MPDSVRRYKYLDVLTTMFVVILLVSNLVAQKVCMIGPFAVSGAVLLVPGHLYLRRRVYRGVWVFGVAAGDLAGVLRDGAAVS